MDGFAHKASNSTKPPVSNVLTASESHFASPRTLDRRNYKSYHKPIRSDPQSSRSNLHNIMYRTNSADASLPHRSARNSEETGIIAIGMALGSPTHQEALPRTHTELTWQPQVLTTITATGNNDDPQAGVLLRSKSKRWNLFSRSKSKKQKPRDAEPQLCFGTDEASPENSGPFFNVTYPGDASKLSGRNQNGNESRATAKHKPIVVRSQTEPTMNMERPQHSNQHLPRGGTATRETNNAVFRGIGQSIDSTKPPLKCHLDLLSSEPLLQVEIPSIEMERYSVMFSNVLRRQQGPTLPDRRHIKLDKLKVPTAGEFRSHLTELPRPRRATSPLPKNSPSFSLFPQDAVHIGSLQKSSPRMRSNTSPANFEPVSPLSQSQQENIAEKSKMMTPTALAWTDAPQLESPTTPSRSRPQLISKFNRGRDSITECESTSDATKQPDSYILTTSQRRPSATAMPRKMSYPGEVIYPRRGSRTEIHHQPLQSSPLKQSQKPLPPKKIVNDAERALNQLNQAVEISIARQISISREQRKMLAPLQSQGQRDRNNSTTNATNAANMVLVGRNKRLLETKTSIPTVVHPEHEYDNRGRTQRKSSRVVLEGT